MRHILTLNPSKARAAAHRAMALAALRADSSLSVRLKRYNAAMARARALDVESLGSLSAKLSDTGIDIERKRRSIKRED